jgi:hypothetical protein
MFTDVNLAGQIDGVELAHFARQHYPNIHVVVTSGLAPPRELPDGTTFMPKPWVAPSTCCARPSVRGIDRASVVQRIPHVTALN